jgi:hypothetical protein
LTNLTDDDLEVPSLGLTVPAGATVETELPDGFDSPSFKVTKSKPTKAVDATSEESA